MLFRLWRISQQRVLGPLGVKQEAFEAFYEFIAAGQMHPPLCDPQIFGFKFRVGCVRRSSLGFRRTIQAIRDMVAELLKHRPSHVLSTALPN